MYKEFDNCLIWFLSFSEIFPDFNWAKETGNLLSIWFGVGIFSPWPFCFLLSTTSSSLSKSGMFVVSISSLSSADSSSDSFFTSNPSMYGRTPFSNTLII